MPHVPSGPYLKTLILVMRHEFGQYDLSLIKSSLKNGIIYFVHVGRLHLTKIRVGSFGDLKIDILDQTLKAKFTFVIVTENLNIIKKVAEW